MRGLNLFCLWCCVLAILWGAGIVVGAEWQRVTGGRFPLDLSMRAADFFWRVK